MKYRCLVYHESGSHMVLQQWSYISELEKAFIHCLFPPIVWPTLVQNTFLKFQPSGEELNILKKMIEDIQWSFFVLE